MREASGPIARYESILIELDEKARNAARRNKPTMWAYYRDMHAGLRDWFSDVTPTDDGFAGASLALSQYAVRRCPELPPTEAARLWALSVYGRRILQSWGTGLERVSLQWLRDREAVVNA